MEDIKGSKRNQVHSLEPNMAVLANFFHKYMAYLLPALLKIGAVRTCHGNKGKEIEKIVRFEVDMALVISSDGFAWSRALKQKLERGISIEVIHNSPSKKLATSILSSTCEEESPSSLVKLLDHETLTIFPLFETPFAPSCNTVKPKRDRWNLTRRLGRGNEELHHCVTTLRRILPGGNEMGVCELLSEVESYIICLELQVSILRSLLMHGESSSDSRACVLALKN